MLLASDLEHDLIEMPLVAGSGQPPPDDVGELLLQAPLPDRLVADAAEGQHLLDHPKAQHYPNAIDKVRFTMAVAFACRPSATLRRLRSPSPS
jgi:hypothetical protein